MDPINPDKKEEGTSPAPNDEKTVAAERIRDEEGKFARKEHLKEPFLKVYAEKRTLTSACKPLGLARSTVYRWRKDDPVFDEKIKEIETELVEVLETSAYNRAIQGSDILTIFLLKALRPEKYKDLVKHEVDHRFIIDVTSQLLNVIKRLVPAEYHNPISEELRRLSEKMVQR